MGLEYKSSILLVVIQKKYLKLGFSEHWNFRNLFLPKLCKGMKFWIQILHYLEKENTEKWKSKAVYDEFINFGWLLIHTGNKFMVKFFQNSKLKVWTKVKKCSLPPKNDFGPIKDFLTSKGPLLFSQKWRLC